jgi:hypothetical protein
VQMTSQGSINRNANRPISQEPSYSNHANFNTDCRTSREGVPLFFGIGRELSAGGNGIIDRPFFRDSTVFRRYCSLKVSLGSLVSASQNFLKSCRRHIGLALIDFLVRDRKCKAARNLTNHRFIEC